MSGTPQMDLSIDVIEVLDLRLLELLTPGCEIIEQEVQTHKDANEGVLLVTDSYKFLKQKQMLEGLILTAHVHQLATTLQLFYTVHFRLDRQKFRQWFKANISHFQGMTLRQLGPFQMVHPGTDPQFFEGVDTPKEPNWEHTQFFTEDKVNGKDFVELLTQPVTYKVERDKQYPTKWSVVRIK